MATIERDMIAPEDIRSGTQYVGLEHVESSGRFVGVREVDAGDLASTKFAFNPSHVLYGKLRPYLCKIARPDFSGVCTTEIVPIKPGVKLDRDYLYHFLRLPRMVEFATSRCSGANLPRLSPKMLADFEIPLPPLAEQKRIAAVLDKADDLRAKRRHALATLDTLLQSVFLDMFGDFKDKRWPRRPFESVVASTQLGLVRSSEQFGDGFDHPYIRMNAITSSGELDHTVVKRTEATAAEVAQCCLASGDLLFNTRNSRELVGKTAIFEGSGIHLFNNNVMRIRFKREVDPYFVLHYLHTPSGDSSLEVIKAGTTSVFAIYWSKLKRLELPVPPVALQAEFRSIAAAITKKRAQTRSCLAQFDGLFASLQSAAFAGTLFASNGTSSGQAAGCAIARSTA